MSAFRLASLCILLLASASLVYADTKTLTADASYIMGDGETPSFAEAMALQRAKQTALEEAGTYVQSYTKSLNQDLTADEVQTIAGGVLQVEVLEKTRTLVGEGLRFYTKIKATVTTDKMEELVRRIKGKNVAEEYTQLQAEYAKVSRELEDWKQRAAKAPQGMERDAALDQIREEAKAFARVQQREGEFFQRLVSGKQLVESVSRDKDIIDGLLKTIVDSGFIVTVGEVKAVAVPGETDILALNVPLTIQLSKTLRHAVSQASSALGGVMRSDVEVSLRTDSFSPLRIGTNDRSKAMVTLVRLGKYLETARYFQDGVMRLGFSVRFLDGTIEAAHCLLLPWGQPASPNRYPYLPQDDNWFAVRRIFPISDVRPSSNLFDKTSGESIDNGAVDEALACEEDEYAKCRYFKRKERLYRTELDSFSRNGYVAIVRDEAIFVAQHRLPAQLVGNLTGVRIRAISFSAQDKADPNKCAIVQ